MTTWGYGLKGQGYCDYLKGGLVYRDISTIMPMYPYQEKQISPDVLNSVKLEHGWPGPEIEIGNNDREILFNCPSPRERREIFSPRIYPPP